MICYLCQARIPDDQSFYNDLGHQVCTPCFKEARRCFICRFPGRELAPVEGLGLECEFCRGTVLAEGMELGPVVMPATPFLEQFGFSPPQDPRYEWVERRRLREMQTTADLPDEDFIDDFLRFCYPVFWREGVHYCLRRMTRATFIVHGLVQLAASDVAMRFNLPSLSGTTPFHTFARGFCHYVGFEAAGRLGFDLEWRQMRKWPELGAQGEFQRWRNMAETNSPAQLGAFFKTHSQTLARKHMN